MVFAKMGPLLLGLLFGPTVGALLHDFSYGSPYLINPTVHETAYVPALSHHQTHIRHGPTFRQIRATRPDWFDPTIPAFQTTLYAPAVHDTHFGILDGLARSFRQDVQFTNVGVAPGLGSALDPGVGLHPAIRNALPYTPAVIHSPSVVEVGAVGNEQHFVGDSGISLAFSTGHLNSLAPSAFYGHSYGGDTLYSAKKKA